MIPLVLSFASSAFAVTCGPVTYPCSFEPPGFPSDTVQKTYTVTLKVTSSLAPIPDESSLDWTYFEKSNSLGDTNGYINSSVEREYFMQLDENKDLIIRFELPFRANEFMNFPLSDEFIKDRLKKDNLVGWLTTDPNFDATDLTVTTVVSNNCDKVDQPCASLSMLCVEINGQGNMECISPCDDLKTVDGGSYLESTCGTYSTCTQPITGNTIGEPECSCAGDYWWTQGEGINTCQPVLVNWLIIVIAVVGFLVVVLIIFLIVFCYMRGCKACGCCKNKEDEEVYKVSHAQINQSFHSDETAKKHPLPDAYSASSVRNPAVWYDMPTDEFGLVRSGNHQGTIMTTASAGEYGATLRSVSQYTGTLEKREKRRHRHRQKSHQGSRSRHQSKDSNPFLEELHREVGKLTREVEDLRKSKRSTADHQPYHEPLNDSDASTMSSTIQAPLPDNSPLDAMELSDESVDGSELHRHASKEILVATPEVVDGPGTLSSTLKERWRVPALKVLPVHDKYPIRSIDSSVI